MEMLVIKRLIENTKTFICTIFSNPPSQYSMKYTVLTHFIVKCSIFIPPENVKKNLRFSGIFRGYRNGGLG